MVFYFPKKSCFLPEAFTTITIHLSSSKIPAITKMCQIYLKFLPIIAKTEKRQMYGTQVVTHLRISVGLELFKTQANFTNRLEFRKKTLLPPLWIIIQHAIFLKRKISYKCIPCFTFCIPHTSIQRAHLLVYTKSLKYLHRLCIYIYILFFFLVVEF